MTALIEIGSQYVRRIERRATPRTARVECLRVMAFEAASGCGRTFLTQSGESALPGAVVAHSEGQTRAGVAR